MSQLGQAAGDFGFAHAGGANHQNVFRGDFGLEAALNLLAPPTVAQGNGHGAFGFGLTHNKAVELGHDVLRRERRHVQSSVSMVWFMLV